MSKNKLINSNKRALQAVLSENFSSLFGGGTPVGGVQTNHPKGYVTGRSSPNLGNAMTGTSGPDVYIVNKEEELTSRAPTLLPFPLDTVFEHLVDSIAALQRVDSQMKSAIENNVTLSRSKLLRLKEMQQDISDYIEKITELGKSIEQINIDEL